ncbi:Far upstream element-binding protein 3, partial [Xenoophorus captivus]
VLGLSYLLQISCKFWVLITQVGFNAGYERQAKRLLVQIVERCRNGPGFHGDGDGGTSVQEMLIPASKVGLVIGRGGDTIKQLQERAGVKMMMIQDGPMPTGADKPLRISGDPYKVQVLGIFFLSRCYWTLWERLK